MSGKGFAVLAAAVLLFAAVTGLGAGLLLAEGGARDTGSIARPSGTAPVPSRSAQARITAQASQTEAAANERVTITGTVVGAEAGVKVLVQRREGGTWVDFPAEGSTGADGTYELFVALGRPGENVMRILAPSIGAASDPVTITIG